jgi:hypothetical protein
MDRRFTNFEDDDDFLDEADDDLLDLDEVEEDDVAEAEARPTPTLAETLAALRDGDDGTLPINRIIAYGLSDLDFSAAQEVRALWPKLNNDYRAKLISHLRDISETNPDLDYRQLAFLALEDDEAEVRLHGADLLWQDDSVEGLKRLVSIVELDEDATVRAMAASTLGHYLLLGEYGDIAEHIAQDAQEILMQRYTDDDEELEVRRRALEALSNSSHEALEDLIREAYHHSERLMRVSAVFAMGRSCDEQWERFVLRELSSNDAEMRYEAARAAGELELKEAVATLIRLARQEDREIQEVAIWSLGEIGGREAQRALTALAEDAQRAEEAALLEVIEEALGNASLVGGDLLP